MRLSLVLLLLLLVGCSGDKDRFTEFEAEYTPAMQELTSLVRATEHSDQDYTAVALADRCKTVSGEIDKRALAMQEKANALRDEEARKASTAVAIDIKDAGKAVADLGATYALRTREPVPGQSQFSHLYDDIFKAGALRDLVGKIETGHAALKGVMARK